MVQLLATYLAPPRLLIRQTMVDPAMSDDGTMATGASDETRDAGPKLYGASGEPLRPSSRSTKNQTDQLADFVKQQPFTAALVALVIGYLLGKVT
jgi:ElaB/YqjD/DUF883 family membrane-anchored ribosome-binding protein